MDTKKELATTQKNEVAVRESGYIVAGENLAGMLAEEMDGLNLSFDKIKTPVGGGLMFELPTGNPDEPEMAKEFKAVILYHHPVHAYYKEKYTGGNAPPDCGSVDGHTGVETETGLVKNCKECDYSKFGSGENGGKACRQRRRLYILRENETLPTVLSVTASSLGDFSKYIMRLLSRGKKASAVVTKFSLKKATNAGGIAFSMIVCGYDRDLTQDELSAVSGITEQVKRFAARTRIVEAED